MVNCKNLRTFALAFEKAKGRLAEGLGTGLQNLLLRFKSGSDLKKRDSSRASFFISVILRKYLYKRKTIILNEVNMSAKYFLNPISPEGADYFPSIEGFISCRKATFSSNHLYADNHF